MSLHGVRLCPRGSHGLQGLPVFHARPLPQRMGGVEHGDHLSYHPRRRCGRIDRRDATILRPDRPDQDSGKVRRSQCRQRGIHER